MYSFCLYFRSNTTATEPTLEKFCIFKNNTQSLFQDSAKTDIQRWVANNILNFKYQYFKEYFTYLLLF